MLDGVTSIAAYVHPTRTRSDASAIYRFLTGHEPHEAETETPADFDRHVFACILAAAASEGGALTQRSGLGDVDLASLVRTYFGGRRPVALPRRERDDPVDMEEIAIVADLLGAHRSSEGEKGRWLCALIARRALEPNHLWEDLGLRDRAELTRLMSVHFQPLFARNTRNMRWKRFIYRLMCEDDGFAMCSTPVCSNCSDYALCFGVEGGTSRLAFATSVPPDAPHARGDG